ncbi:MAG: dTDP-4-amino-4,6-dideoxygalactose transaminase [Pyrinomonadaceae bacterium]
MAYHIPFNRPEAVGNEAAYMREALASGHLSGDGEFTRRCHALLEELLGVTKTLLTTSCTHALEMCALLLNIKEGDEVVIPSFTFVSTANAFVLRGARPRFVDVRADTLNLDETLLEQALTEKTKAIVPVHYAGVGCEMNKIMELAARHQIAVIEDNAHGLFGKYRGRFLGTFGALATQSFHETKSFSCGEGGALLIDDASLIERAEIIREKGTNRSRFFRGQVEKYTWQDIGSSYLPSDLLAAFLLGQLEAREKIQTRRREIWQEYDRSLRGWAEEHNVTQPSVPESCEQSFHIYYLLMPTPEARRRFISHLKAHGVASAFHYLPLHLSAMGQRFGGKVGDCPVTEDTSERLVRLPFFNTLSREEQAHVIEAVKSFSP